MIFERLRKLCEPRLAVLLFILTGLAVYFGAFTAGFVWDDPSHLIENPNIHSFHNYFSTFFDPGFYFYHPVGDFLSTCMWVFFGPNPMVFHGSVVLMHIGVVISLYFLFRRFFGNEIAFALSFLFLVHPINVEAVTNIASHTEPLSALFGIWALILLTDPSSLWRQLLAVLLLCASLFTKESGIIFLLVAPLYVYLTMGRVPRVLLWGEILTVFTRMLQHSSMPYYPKEMHPELAMINAPLYERMLTVPKMLLYYVHTLLYPDVLAIWQNWIVREVTLQDFWGPLLMCLGIGIIFTAAVFYVYRQRRDMAAPLITFLALFTLSLGIHLQIVPLDMTVADRWFYTPLIGLLGVFGYLVWHLWRSEKLSSVTWGIVALVLIVACAGFAWRTIARNADWQDVLALYGHDVHFNDTNSLLTSDYGVALLDQVGVMEAEIPIMERASTMAPRSVLPYTNLGYLYLKFDRIEESAWYYRKALTLSTLEKAYVGLGTAYLRLPDKWRALHFLEFATKMYPRNPVLWDLLVIANYQYGRYELSRLAHAVARDTQKWTIDESEKMAASFEKRLDLIPAVIHTKVFVPLRGGLQ